MRRRLRKGGATVASLRWSNTATWGGTLPIAGDDVVISGGTTIIWDVNTPALNSLTINGVLDADATLDLTLTSKTISVTSGGEWLVGRSNAPYTKNMTITLNGVKGAATSTSTVNSDGGGVNRGILVTNAKWKFYGNPPTFDRTYLNADAAATATSLTFADSVGWPTGTNIAIANTKYYGEAATEFRVLNGATSGTSATVTAGLTYAHLGRKQYPVELSSTVTITNASPGVVTWNAHGMVNDKPVILTTSGTLPTGLTAGKTYYARSVATNTFQVAEAPGGTSINTSSAGSGTHTAQTGDMSFTQGTFSAYKAHANVPTELDQRALVINLDRNIIIQAPNDSEWSGANAYGVHTMVMDTNGTGATMLDGVQFRRAGQENMLGRYPVHFHMLSYTEATWNGSAFVGGGVFTNEASNHTVKNCSIWESKFRAITVHGTCGATVYRNVCADIRGNAIFLEDHSERRNIIDGNVVMKVRDVTVSGRIKSFDASQTGNGASVPRGVAGLWLTNANNYVRNNHVSDCQGNGIDNVFLSFLCLGTSSNVSIAPIYMELLEQTNNTSHSNQGAAMVTRFGVSDNSGTIVDGNIWRPTTDGTISGTLSRATISLFKGWKNGALGYVNGVILATYSQWTLADNREMNITGAVGDGTLIPQGLMIGRSLNTGTNPLGEADFPLTAVASYHETGNFQDTTFVNFPWTDYYDPAPGEVNMIRLGGGSIRSQDLYLIPLDKGYKRNSGLKFLASHPGFMVRPPHIDGRTNITGGDKRQWTLSGARWDYHGYLGAAQNYLVHNDTFLTYGLSSSTEIPPIGKNQGYSTPDVFFGVFPYVSDENPVLDYTYSARIRVEQVDSGGTVQGTWDVPEAVVGSGSSFGFRHFAARKTGRYIMHNPTVAPNALKVVVEISGLINSADYFYLAFDWDGTIPAKAYQKVASQGAYYAPGENDTDRLIATSSANMAALVASTDGKTYFQDTANNLFWMKLYGGLRWWPFTLVTDTDYELYQGMYLTVVPQTAF